MTTCSTCQKQIGHDEAVPVFACPSCTANEIYCEACLKLHFYDCGRRHIEYLETRLFRADATVMCLSRLLSQMEEWKSTEEWI